MKIAARILLPTLLLGVPVALAAEAPAEAPAGAPTAQAAKTTAKATAKTTAKTIDVSFRGSLRDALKKIAEDGGINVVATGGLDTAVEVHLKGVTAEQALRTIARTYSLQLDEDGSIFTLRPMTNEEAKEAREAKEEAKEAKEDGDEEREEMASAAPQAVAPPAGVPEVGPGTQGVPPVPPVPPLAVPPVPPMPPGVSGTPGEDFDPQEIQERVRKEVRKAQRRHKGERDVVARGHSLEVKEHDEVDNAVVYGGNLVVRGHVEEDAVAFGGNLDVYGVVEGDAHAFGGSVVLHKDASVKGDVSSIGGDVIREDGAWVEGSTESFGGGNVGTVVAGEVKKSLKKEFRKAATDDEDEEDDRRSAGLPWFIIKFAALFGLGFLGQIFFPARMKELSAEIKAQPIKAGLVGFLGMLALFPISLVLVITILGIPVAFALWLVVTLAAVLGYTAVASEIGLRLPIMRGRKTQAVVLALGLLITLLVGSIPVLGWLVTIPLVMMGLGGAILSRFGNRLRGIPEPLSRTTIGV